MFLAMIASSIGIKILECGLWISEFFSTIPHSAFRIPQLNKASVGE